MGVLEVPLGLVALFVGLLFVMLLVCFEYVMPRQRRELSTHSTQHTTTAAAATAAAATTTATAPLP